VGTDVSVCARDCRTVEPLLHRVEGFSPVDGQREGRPESTGAGSVGRDDEIEVSADTHICQNVPVPRRS